VAESDYYRAILVLSATDRDAKETRWRELDDSAKRARKKMTEEAQEALDRHIAKHGAVTRVKLEQASKGRRGGCRFKEPQATR